MEMTGEQFIPLPQQRVWEALNDPELGKLKSLPEFARLVNEFSKKKTN